jgi:aspartate carbamoyltransferase catalytic subunit
MVSRADFHQGDIISIKDFAREQLEFIFDTAAAVEREPATFHDALEGRVVAILFFEPSTRTHSSFEISAHQLGCTTTGFAEASVSSVAKGETLYDTVRMFEGYGAQAIVMRHPKMGAARFAAEVAQVPVINAGDGSREHPTQAMLDLYTVRKLFGKIDGLRIGLLGDLKYGRTASSLSYALAQFDVELLFVAPEALQMRREVELYLAQHNTKVEHTTNLKEAVRTLDVLYVTRIQKERIPDPTEYERLRGLYRVNLAALEGASPSLKVLHPLPRVDEIPPELDTTRFAQYFTQAASGLPVRTALLHLILGERRT